MINVSRSDIYARDERGPAWFDEFLYSFSRSEESTTEGKLSVQEILNAINNKRTETVDSVVQDYRKQVGIDLVQSSDDVHEQNIKRASANFRPLSIRHAEKKVSVIDKIKSDPELVSAIESLCRHSGGTKKIQSLITFIRNHMGDAVSFSDEGVVKYLNECKDKFRENIAPDLNADHVGLVGTTNDSTMDRDDDIADYIKNDGAK